MRPSKITRWKTRDSRGPRAYLSSISCISCLNTNRVNLHTHTHTLLMSQHATLAMFCTAVACCGPEGIPANTKTAVSTHTHTHICKAFRSSVSLNAQCQLCRDYTGSRVDNCNKTVQLMKAGLRLSTRINSAMLDTQTPPHLHFRIKLDAFMATRRNILSFRGWPLRVNFV